MGFFGQEYELVPIVPPQVNLNHILAAPAPLAETIVKRYPDHLQIIYFDAHKLPGFPKRLEIPPQEISKGSRLMIIRDAGIGDMIMLSSALRELKKEVGPGVELLLATLRDRHPLMYNSGLLEHFFPLPIPLSDLVNTTDYYFLFSDPRGIFGKVNMIDYYLDSFSIDYRAIDPEDKIPFLSPCLTRSDEIISSIRENTPDGHIRVLYSPGASDPWRQLPPRVLNLLAVNYGEFVFFVPKYNLHGHTQHGNVFEIDTSGDLIEFVTAIEECDILVSADSAAYHIAATMNKPSLVLFGPIDTKPAQYYPSATALEGVYEGEVCRFPCGISGHAGRFARKPIGANKVTRFEPGTEVITHSGRPFIYDPRKGCPEANITGTKYSPCLDLLPDERILEGFEKVLAQYKTH